MAVLDTNLGWVVGDDVRVLIAAGLGISQYTIEVVIGCMNNLGGYAPGAVVEVRELLDEFDTADAELSILNAANQGRVLVKADVLEWEQGGSGETFGLSNEFARIRERLMLYFSGCEIFTIDTLGANHVNLFRS